MSTLPGRTLATSLLSSASIAIGIGAHFYLVLVVAIVQAFLRDVGHTGAAIVDEASEHLLGPWALSIYVLVTALLLVAVSFLARWSWPIVPEKGLLLVLVWLLVGSVVAALGFCTCCGGACGGWPQHVFSLAWLLAVAAAFSVDARALGLRNFSLGVVVLFSVLGLAAPFNPCHWMPEVSWLMFARITLFHALWYTNRLLRIAESTIYHIYTHHITQANAQVPPASTSAETRVAIAAPQDLLSAWRVLDTLAAALNAPAAFHSRLVQNAGHNNAQYRLASAIQKTLAALPRLDAFGQHEGADGDGKDAPFVNWKYRHYSPKYMIAIDAIRAVWVLSVCAPYTLVAVLELAWLVYALSDTCTELAAAFRAAPASDGTL